MAAWCPLPALEKLLVFVSVHGCECACPFSFKNKQNVAVCLGWSTSRSVLTPALGWASGVLGWRQACPQ